LRIGKIVDPFFKTYFHGILILLQSPLDNKRPASSSKYYWAEDIVCRNCPEESTYTGNV
jgi:hypothetical protein